MSAAQVKSLYASMPENLANARRKLGRPLTLSEKILVARCHDFAKQEWERGTAILHLDVDRVALQDVTGQNDRVTISGLYALEPSKPVKVIKLEPQDTKAKPGKDV